MSLVAEIAAAVAVLTGLGRPPRSNAALAGGLAFLPLVGLALGAVVAAVAALADAGVPGAGAIAGAGGLVLASGGRGPRGLAAAAEALLRPGPPSAVRARLDRRPGPIGVAVASAAVLAEALALGTLAAPARTAALLAAPMLGAWGIVVQCYGGAPTHARGLAAALVGRARFREFGWASVTALGLMLGMGQAIGLAVVVASALTITGLRVLAHRRMGGLTGEVLAATRTAVEAVVLGLLGLLAAAASAWASAPPT